MQKKHFLSVIILSCLIVANTGCSKDDDNPAPKTKTELMTMSHLEIQRCKGQWCYL